MQLCFCILFTVASNIKGQNSSSPFKNNLNVDFLTYCCIFNSYQRQFFVQVFLEMSIPSEEEMQQALYRFLEERCGKCCGVFVKEVI